MLCCAHLAVSSPNDTVCHRRGDKWVSMELSFTHVTTKTWAHSRRLSYFRRKKLSQILPPWSNHILKINRISIVSKLQGMEVSPGHENNSWWEWLGQVEWVLKNHKKNMKTGKVVKILRNNNLIKRVCFSQSYGKFGCFHVFSMFKLIPPVLLTTTNYCIYD